MLKQFIIKKKNTAKPQKHFNKKHGIFYCKINQLNFLYKHYSFYIDINQYGVNFCIELTNCITSRIELINELLCVIFFAIISNF